ncbi:MAG TPA: hypothetical protein VLD58_11260 [Gemmatimonadales bacterium]|nr:hypothetical protein [Gemmatimonadales bacterium]
MRRLIPLVLGLLFPLALAPAAAQSPALRLRMQPVRDPMMGNEEAFRLLVPHDWRTEGGLVWRSELSTLVYLQLRLSDPRGVAGLEFFPTPPFTWSMQGYPGFPPGSLYLGSYVAQPMDPENFVRQLILPQLRGRVSPRVIRTEPLPKLAQEVAPSVQEAGAVKQVVAARTRIEYEEGGRALEEDIYVVLVYSQVPLTPQYVWWGPDRAFGFRAEKGQLDRQAPLLEAMLASLRVNRLWFAKVIQVRQMWIQNQMQAIRNAAELSRYIARTSDEISDMQQQAWENKRASEERTSQAYTEYIRGVETYHDSYAGRDVHLPTGYSQVWASRDGEYILANDVNFNPNEGGRGTWQRIGPAQ